MNFTFTFTIMVCYTTDKVQEKKTVCMLYSIVKTVWCWIRIEYNFKLKYKIEILTRMCMPVEEDASSSRTPVS